MEKEDLKLYVGTYAKYNNSDLSGDWLTLADYADYDDFMDACRALHADENDPEIMFQDYEGGELMKHYYSESGINEEIFEILNDDSIDLDAVDAYIYCFGDWDKDSFEDNFQGQYDSDEDFAEELVESCGDIPRDLPSYIYIDWGNTARDIMMDYCEHGGYYFRNS